MKRWREIYKNYQQQPIKKITELNTKITNVESTTVNSIQIINTASKTSNDETNIKINNIKDNLNNEIIKINNKDEELAVRIADIEEFNGELNLKFIKIQNLITQDKLNEIRKNLDTFVIIFNEKITNTNKIINDKHNDIQNLLFDQNNKFKLVKNIELEVVINNLKEINEKVDEEVKKIEDKLKNNNNNVRNDFNVKIRRIDNNLEKLNTTKVPYQFKVASFIATDKADKVEIFGTTISGDGSNKVLSYDILSRVVSHDNFKSFKTIVEHYIYFEGDDNIITPKVGLKVGLSGTYIIESKFFIKIKKNRNVSDLRLRYKHNGNIDTIPMMFLKKSNQTVDENGNKIFKWSELKRYDLKSGDTLDIKLYAWDVLYEDNFESFNNSSIEIYRIENIDAIYKAA